MPRMNRRNFAKSLAALFAVPALPAIPMAAPATTQVPTVARFWAIYMSGLNGHCSPLTIQTALNVSKAEAEGYLAQLVREGVITPRPVSQAQVRPDRTEPVENPIRRMGSVILDNHARLVGWVPTHRTPTHLFQGT